MNYKSTIIFFLLLVFSISSTSASVDITSKSDTIPDDGYFYDTITVFDKETYVERTVIYRTKIEGYRYDTIMIFDPETYEEIIKITKLPYGSEKELVEPEEKGDEMLKLLQCYQVKWGAITHDYVFGSPNRVYLNPKMVDEVLESEITIVAADGCEESSGISSLVIMAQYDNGTNDTVAQGASTDNRSKLLNSKRRKKEGTFFTLKDISIEIGDRTIDLPYIQFVVKK